MSSGGSDEPLPSDSDVTSEPEATFSIASGSDIASESSDEVSAAEGAPEAAAGESAVDDAEPVAEDDSDTNGTLDEAEEPEAEADDDEPEDEGSDSDSDAEPASAAPAPAAPARPRRAAAPPAPAPGRRGRGRREPRAVRPVVRAQAKYVRSSARKARLVCDHIRGKTVEEARAILAVTPRAVARDWSKLLESAVANAEHNHELVGEDLFVKAVHADEGPTIKRFRPRAMGRATKIRKRTAHLTILLTPKDR